MLNEIQFILIACSITIGIMIHLASMFILEHFGRISFDTLEAHLKWIGYAAVVGFMFMLVMIFIYMIWRLVT